MWILEKLAYLIGYAIPWLLLAFVIAFLIGCATRVEYKDVYIPQRCEVEIPPKIQCGAVSTEYDKIVQCMIDNQKRTELLEARLKFCIGDK